MTQDLFNQLLNKGESTTLDYKEIHYFSPSNVAEKKDKDTEFIKDILSFVNTPRDETAYILIGVKEDSSTKKGVAIGINPSDIVDNSNLQAKVRSKVTPSIFFKSYIFIDENKNYFNIIEIPVIWYPSPCVATFTNGNILVKEEVYIRADSGNVKAHHSEVTKIYDWLKTIPKSTVPTNIEITGNSNKLFFDEETIQKLFGNEAAEDEDLLRLKEYYLKNDIYKKVTVNLPIRILVGHKGTGKSALFKIAKQEDADAGKLAIIIKPDEISFLGKNLSDFLETITNWKEGLLKIILKKSLIELGIVERPIIEFDELNGNFIEYITNYVESQLDEGKIKTNKINIVNSFIEEPIINIYIDDLDRGWIGGKTDINRISALLNAIRDLTQENKKIQFKISLRSDVYYLVRTSDESTDKIGNSVIWYQWSYHQILVLLAKRIRTFFKKKVDEQFLLSATQSEIAESIYDIIEPYFSGLGKWENKKMYNVLLSVIRKRPRDLVKLLTLAARNANSRGADKIMTQDLKAIFDIYSQDRIQDTVNEYRSELPHVERLILGMKPDRKAVKASESYYFTTQQLKLKINKIMEQGQFIFANGKKADAKDLAQFLYKINFITATKKLSDGYIDRKDFEENRYLSSEFVDFGYDWEIHMAFRWGLQPNSQENFFIELGK